MNLAEIDLTECPEEISNLDANAEVLWLKLLRKSGIDMDTARKRVIDNGSKRADVIYRLAIPDLAFRLECQKHREDGKPQDDRKRAAIWWHVAESCVAGESIPDLSEETMYLLNPFIVPAENKYENKHLEELANRPGIIEMPVAVYCANPNCKRGPEGTRNRVVGRAKTCSTACRVALSRGGGQTQVAA